MLPTALHAPSGRSTLESLLPCPGLLVAQRTTRLLRARDFTATRKQRAFESAALGRSATRMTPKPFVAPVLTYVPELFNSPGPAELPPLAPTQFDQPAYPDLRWGVASLAATVAAIIAAIQVAF